jgi:hypothetical protein
MSSKVSCNHPFIKTTFQAFSYLIWFMLSLCISFSNGTFSVPQILGRHRSKLFSPCICCSGLIWQNQLFRHLSECSLEARLSMLFPLLGLVSRISRRLRPLSFRVYLVRRLYGYQLGLLPLPLRGKRASLTSRDLGLCESGIDFHEETLLHYRIARHWSWWRSSWRSFSRSRTSTIGCSSSHVGKVSARTMVTWWES